MRLSVSPRFAAAWVLVGAMGAYRSPSAAAEDVEAIFRKGTELRRQGRDAEALTEFQRAGRLQDSPRASAQIALAEQALGLWIDANTHLTKALERGSDPWIQKNRGPLDEALRTIQAHLCEVVIWGGPAGAEVLIDGKRLGALPKVSTFVLPGSVPFQVKADGYVELARSLTAPEGGRLREHVDLRAVTATQAKKVDTAAPPPPPEPETVNMTAGATTSPAGETANETAEDSPLYRRWWFWTIIGAGVVAAGGATAWVLTHRTADPQTCSGTCTTW